MKRSMIISALALALAACGGGDAANNAVTPEEGAALDNTAEMLDASPDSLIANSEAPLGNGEAPALDSIGEEEAGTNAAAAE